MGGELREKVKGDGRRVEGISGCEGFKGIA